MVWLISFSIFKFITFTLCFYQRKEVVVALKGITTLLLFSVMLGAWGETELYFGPIDQGSIFTFISFWIGLEFFDFLDSILNKDKKFSLESFLSLTYPILYFLLPQSYFLILPLMYLAVLAKYKNERLIYGLGLFSIYLLKSLNLEEYIGLIFLLTAILSTLVLQKNETYLNLIILFPLSLMSLPAVFLTKETCFLGAVLFVWVYLKNLFRNFNSILGLDNQGFFSLMLVFFFLSRKSVVPIYAVLMIALGLSINRAILVRLSLKNDQNLKEMFSKNQVLWFVCGLYFLSMLGLPPAPSFTVFSLQDFFPEWFYCAFSILSLSLLIHFLFGAQKMKMGFSKTLFVIFESNRDLYILLAGYAILNVGLYFDILGVITPKNYQKTISFSWWWSGFLMVSIALAFFVLTSEKLFFLRIEDFLRKVKPQLRPSLFSTQEKKYHEFNEEVFRVKNILPRVPTQWAFFSWAISLALGLSILFSVMYGS